MSADEGARRAPDEASGLTLARLRAAVSEAGAEAMLVTQPANVRYLSGFRSPEDARVVVTEESAVLLTDGRYIAQAQEESRLPFDVAATSTAWRDLALQHAGGRRLAFEADHVTFDLAEALRRAASAELVPVRGLVEELRLRKSPLEIERLRHAARLTDQAFEHILGVMKAGMTEVDVALELESFMRRNGAERKSFDIIVASGVRSAMPHGVASMKPIERGDLVTLDFGAVWDGYHADMTRAVAIGPVSDSLRRMFDATLEAQQAALAAVAPGRDGSEVDRVARDVLERHGLLEAFAHSTGHGVGLQIHEGPRLAQRGTVPLEPGMVVTVEPGVYVPGEGGVRIEDLVLVTESGAERLSKADTSYVEVG